LNLLSIQQEEPSSHTFGSDEAMAPSLRALVSYASNFVSQLPFLNSNFGHVSPYEPLSGAPSCPLDGPMSCHNNTPITGDSCCFVSPGGRMLLTQFWDQQVHAGGAEQDWTLHGLWYGIATSPSLGVIPLIKDVANFGAPDGKP
jgi:hypothetical protein